MAVDIQQTFQQGGKPLIDLLEYCVVSTKLETLFLFLVGEYQTRPTTEGAFTLFDTMCVERAPARLKAYEALPPRNLDIRMQIQRLRQNQLDIKNYQPQPLADGEDPPPRPIAIMPSRYLFDSATKLIHSSHADLLQQVSQDYDPEKTPYQNLPGGRMNAGQKAFVDNVWTPIVRPRLVAAGFRRISNIA